MDMDETTDRALPAAVSRRRFLGLGALAATAASGLAAIARPHGAGAQVPAPTATPRSSWGPLPSQRASEAYNMRVNAARAEYNRPAVSHANNGDEALYPQRLGNFSKGLPHNGLGEVDLAAYNALLVAVKSGRMEDWERVPMGGTARLTNPMAGMDYTLQGPDSHSLAMVPPPAFASAGIAAEMAENYWMALARDVAFEDYGSHPLTQAAAADLNGLAGYRGPKIAGQVTPGALFRGLTPGDLAGPYVSQFMLRATPFGAEAVDRRMRTMLPGSDYLTAYAEWLAVQRGAGPTAGPAYDPVHRYIRNGRDLGEWVHIDVLFQAYFNAMLVMFDLRVPYDGGNPYQSSTNQIGFGTLGDPYCASVLAAIAKPALEAVWHKKWYVHRRLRPEVFGGRVHNHVTGAATYPIHGDILNSPVLDEVFSRHGSYLLPMGYPEGSPTHPAYGAGHATVAGACTTVLKAFFDEAFVLPSPVVPSADGLSLLPYNGPPLTVGGELNKLAANVAVGRNIAGVHWRSDATESLLMGEELAIRYLREEKACLRERMIGWSLTKFDGTTVSV